MKVAPLLLAGLAAFGYYKYSKMSEQEKKDLLNKGKKFMDENLGSLKDVFAGKAGNQTASNGFGKNSFTQS
jgi:hypothetical protein